MSGLKDEKLINKANLRENWNMQTLFQSFLNISAKSSKSITIILSYTVLKLVHFLRHSVVIFTSSDVNYYYYYTGRCQKFIGQLLLNYIVSQRRAKAVPGPV